MRTLPLIFMTFDEIEIDLIKIGKIKFQGLSPGQGGFKDLGS